MNKYLSPMLFKTVGAFSIFVFPPISLELMLVSIGDVSKTFPFQARRKARLVNVFRIPVFPRMTVCLLCPCYPFVFPYIRWFVVSQVECGDWSESRLHVTCP